MHSVIVTIACLLGMTILAQAWKELDYYAYPKYQFKYDVKDPHTGDVKGQWEKRHGDKVYGEYQVNDPDGTIRVVKYSADKESGFNARVERIGKAIHPIPIRALKYGGWDKRY